jgi:hypothetical protein
MRPSHPRNRSIDQLPPTTILPPPPQINLRSDSGSSSHGLHSSHFSSFWGEMEACGRPGVSMVSTTRK